MLQTGLMSKERFERLVGMSRKMSGASTEAAKLVLVNGLSQKDAAAEKGISVAAVSSKIKRILLRERELLSAFNEIGG